MNISRNGGVKLEYVKSELPHGAIFILIVGYAVSAGYFLTLVPGTEQTIPQWTIAEIQIAMFLLARVMHLVKPR